MTDDDRYEAMAKVAGLQALKITEQGRRLLDAKAKIAALEAWVEYLKPQNTQLSAQLAEAKTEVEVLRHCNAWQARELNQLRPAPEAKDLEPAPPALTVNEWVAQHAERHAVLLFPRLDPDAPPEPQPLWAGVDFSAFQPDSSWPQVWRKFPGVLFNGADRSATLLNKEPTMNDRYHLPVAQGLLDHLDYLLELIPLTTEDGMVQLLVACLSVPKCLLDLKQIDVTEAHALEDRIQAAFAAHYPLHRGLFDDNPPRGAS